MVAVGVEEDEELDEADMGLDSSDCDSLGFLKPCLITTNVSNPRAAFTINCSETDIFSGLKSLKTSMFKLDCSLNLLSGFGAYQLYYYITNNYYYNYMTTYPIDGLYLWIKWNLYLMTGLIFIKENMSEW